MAGHKKLTTQSVGAEAFRKGTGYPEESIYVFPFTALDAPGPHSRGRMEWWLEPLRSRKRRGRYDIIGLYLWACQTRDPRYEGKLFHIPCHAGMLYGQGIGLYRNGLLNHAWTASFCHDHGVVCFGAYPRDWHTALEIDVSLSIMATALFLPEQGGP